MTYQPAAGYLAAGAAGNYLPKAGGTMAGQFFAAEGNAGAPGIVFAGDGNTGFCHLGDDVIGVVCGGTLVGRFTTGGFQAVKVTQGAM